MLPRIAGTLKPASAVLKHSGGHEQMCRLSWKEKALLHLTPGFGRVGILMPAGPEYLVQINVLSCLLQNFETAFQFDTQVLRCS